MDNKKLIELLNRAIKLQQQQWVVQALIESAVTNNNGLTEAQSQKMIEVIAEIASEGDVRIVDEKSVEYLTKEIAKVCTVIRRPLSVITPMSYEEFAKKYSQARIEAGDHVDDTLLTQAYAVYCNDPDGHFLHKEK